MSRSNEAEQMAGFGEYLRREREMRGVSLDEISAATKISIRFLKAIEDEELASLPGGIFTRSFVRTYARYLGLDEERVLADCQLSGRQKPEVDIRRIPTNRAPRGGGASRTRIVALLVAFILLALGYALFLYSRRMAEQQSSAPLLVPAGAAAPATNPASSATPAPSQPSTPTQTAGNEAQPAPSTTTGASSAATAPGTPPGGPSAPASATNQANPAATPAASNGVAPNTDLELQVAAAERVWVAIEADGKTVQQKVLNANEVENLKAHNSFDVTVGNAQGIVLTLNGETLKPLGRRGEVKSVHLTREDLKNPTPER
jgi:cytoskeleton protein RodZ